jgi:hypothetical protein
MTTFRLRLRLGVPADDEKAAAATPPLPAVDSLNLWALLSRQNRTSPRREWALTPFGEDTSCCNCGTAPPRPGCLDRDDPHGGGASRGRQTPHRLFISDSPYKMH